MNLDNHNNGNKKIIINFKRDAIKQKSEEEIKSDCLEKLNKIEENFKSISQNLNNINYLKKQSKIVQDTLDIVQEAYSKLDMPSDVLQQFIKSTNYRLKYIEMINKKELFNIQARIKIFNTDMNNTIKQFNKKFDNIWSNVLAVILSFSMVAAMTEGISKISGEWVVLFCLFVIWLGMTLLVFFSNLFEEKGLGPKTSRIMYVFVTSITIIVLFFTILFYPKKQNEKELINEQVETPNEKESTNEQVETPNEKESINEQEEN